VAGVNATASLSLMVSVAVATSLAVSAIVAGPTLLACAKSPGGLGACLHAEFAKLEPNPPAIPATVPHVDPPTGQMEANAGPVLAPSASPPTLLTGPTGSLSGGGSTAASETVAEVALAPAGGSLMAGTDPQITDAIGVELSRAPGRMDASAFIDAPAPVLDTALTREPGTLEASAPPPTNSDEASVALGAGAGEVSAALAAAPDALAAATILSVLPGWVSTTATSPTSEAATNTELSAGDGHIDVSGVPAPASTVLGVELAAPTGVVTAAGASSAALDMSITLTPVVSAEASNFPAAPPASEAIIEQAAPPPDPPNPPAPVTPPPQIDPRFPNVLTLSAPSGSGTSITTLQLN
jgi:hypothetical protein